MIKSTDQYLSYLTDKYYSLDDFSKISILGAAVLIFLGNKTAWFGVMVLLGVFFVNKISNERAVDKPPGSLFNRGEHSDLSDKKLDLLEELAKTYNVEIKLMEKPGENSLIPTLTWDAGWKGQAVPEKNLVELEKAYVERAETYNVEHLALHEIGHCILKDTGVKNQMKRALMISGEDGDAEKWAAKKFSGTKEQYYELHAQTYYDIKVGNNMFPWLKEERSDWF